MSTIIFDFDHTLLDSTKITEMIEAIFLESGATLKTILAVQKAQRLRDNDNPDFLAQVTMLKDLGYDIKDEVIDDFFGQDLEKCLKGPDVKEVLEKLFKAGHKLILFTKGIEYFQKFKIRQSGLEKYFKGNIYIFDNNKEEAEVDIHQNGKVYFINDHADEIEAFAKIHPGVKFIYVKGPKTSHDRFLKHKHIPTIDNVSTLLKYIK